MLLIKIIYILFSVSFIYSQTYFDRIIGGDVQFGDARSMGLANSYTTTGSTSSITSRNPARLSYLANGNKGISFDFQFNLQNYYERRSIDIFDTFGDFSTETDYVSNQHGHFYRSLGFIMSRKNPNKNLSYGLGLSLMPLTSFNYTYEEEVRFENMDIDTPGDIGIVDAALGFHIYNSKGTIDLASLGFGFSYFTRPGMKNSISAGVSFNQILSTTITDEISIDTLYNAIDPSVYNNLSNFENTHHSIDTKTTYYPTYSFEFPIKKSSIVFSFEPNVSILDNSMHSNLSISELSGLPWYLDYDDETNMYSLKLNGTEYFKPKKITFGLRLDEPKHSGSLMIFEFIKESYSRYNTLINDPLDQSPVNEIFRLKDVYHYKFAFEHKFRLGPAIRMGLAYRTSMISLLNPLTKFTMGSSKKINKNLDIDFALSYYITNYRYDDIFPSTAPNNETNCNEYCEKINESNMTISTTFKWGF